LDSTAAALFLSLLAGSTIPLGAALANLPRFFPTWSDTELRHSVAAFGGGALLAAIAFVLVPEAADRLAPVWVIASFLGGGLVFFLVDRALKARGGAGATFLAMMLDYVPEAMALGALIAGQPQVAVLTAGLIALQNLPESFSAYREIVDAHAARAWKVFALFLVMAFVGPVAALLGLFVLADLPQVLGAVMAFAAGGILYLVFEDVAPSAVLEGQSLPPIWAVAGFALGLSGYLFVE
jgi:ZIP family zinc transporter